MHLPHQLDQLKQLPRPLYGQAESLPNIALSYDHSHPWIQLSYASQGVLEVLTTAGRYLAPPQRAVWIPAGIEHRVQCFGQPRIRSLYIEQAALTSVPQAACVIQVSPLLRELIQTFSTFDSHYPLQGCEARLAQVLLDQLQQAPVTDSVLPLPQDARALHIARHLQQQPDCSRPLAGWAAELGVSEKTLSRLFSRQTGLAFRRWRQRLRILSSLSMLEQKQPVTDVALSCGYESVSAFIHAFSQHFHCTPGEFFTS